MKGYQALESTGANGAGYARGLSGLLMAPLDPQSECGLRNLKHTQKQVVMRRACSGVGTEEGEHSVSMCSAPVLGAFIKPKTGEFLLQGQA